MQVFDELLTEIEQIPAIDIHSRIRADSPGAADLSDIVLGDGIVSDLRSAGVSPELLETEGTKKKVYELAGHLEKIKNTTTYWCLTQILDGLYQTERPAHESDVDELWGKVEQSAGDPNRASTVLDRANVSKVLVACDWYRAVPAASERFVPVVRLDRLINEPFSPKVLDALAEMSGQTVYEAGDLSKAVAELLRKAAGSGSVAVCASFEPHIDFERGSRDSADRILSLVLLRQKTNRDDRKALRSYVMDQVLKACADHGMVFQLMLGLRRAAGERRISAFETGMLSAYSDLFARHPNVKFDVFAADETLGRELAVVARNYANVYLSGHWCYGAFPTRMRNSIRERIEMLPMGKSCGFLSDAGCVEWVYAMAVLTRRELALALSQMVDEGYLSRSCAGEAARSYLLENPKRLYKIEQTGSGFKEESD